VAFEFRSHSFSLFAGLGKALANVGLVDEFFDGTQSFRPFAETATGNGGLAGLVWVAREIA
jgi:hypothetical protein